MAGEVDLRPELITVIVGIITFVVTLIALAVFMELRNRKTKDLVVQRSFEPVAGLSGSANIDIPKESELSPEPAQDKNRWRFYLFGLLATGVFGSLLAKLWSLQLLSGDYYKQQALENRRQSVPIPAIRGRLLDRKGIELVGNRPTLIVTAPKSVSDDRNLVHRLSLVLGVPAGVLRQKLLDDRLAATAQRILATDVSMRAASYIQTHPHLFAEITIKDSSARYYPFGTLAAHVLGYIGPVTQDELDAAAATEADSDLSGDDFIGKVGAEWVFQDKLKGTKGEQIYQVDAYGNPTKLLEETAPVNGADVCLTIDFDIQRATDRILREIIASARDIGRQYCNAGALVAIDIEDGGILAMSSWPTYSPEAFTNGISQDLWDSLTREDADNPLLNRVTMGLYPAASTFKAFTSLAGFHYGLIDDHSSCYCSGYWTEFGTDWGQKCWIYPYGHGRLDFEDSVNQSCDIFFYDLAAAFYNRWELMPEDKPERFNELQTHLRSWGFGSLTGLDGLSEAPGRVPDAKWKREAFADTPEDYDWWPGDMTNVIIGQGDILVTPLQLCNGYAGIARRKMLKPHIFHREIDAEGHTLESYEIRESDIQPEFDLNNVLRLEEGFRRVVARNGGPFNKLPVSVLAKTGTGETTSKPETYSWFVAYAPADDPKYCVACVVEQAGTGDSVAMQAVQHTLATIYGVDIGEVHAGKGTGER